MFTTLNTLRDNFNASVVHKMVNKLPTISTVQDVSVIANLDAPLSIVAIADTVGVDVALKCIGHLPDSNADKIRCAKFIVKQLAYLAKYANDIKPLQAMTAFLLNPTLSQAADVARICACAYRYTRKDIYAIFNAYLVAYASIFNRSVLKLDTAATHAVNAKILTFLRGRVRKVCNRSVKISCSTFYLQNGLKNPLMFKICHNGTDHYYQIQL